MLALRLLSDRRANTGEQFARETFITRPLRPVLEPQIVVKTSADGRFSMIFRYVGHP